MKSSYHIKKWTKILNSPATIFAFNCVLSGVGKCGGRIVYDYQKSTNGEMQITSGGKDIPEK